MPDSEGEVNINSRNENLKTGGNWLARGIVRVRDGASDAAKRHDVAVHRGVILTLHALVFTYVVSATCHWFLKAGGSYGQPIDYCNGVGMVWILMGFIYLLLLYFQVIKPYFGVNIYINILKPIGRTFDSFWTRTWIRRGTYVIIVFAIAVFVIFDLSNSKLRLISCCGIVLLILLGFLFSKHPGHIRWRPVFVGLGLQFAFALMSIRWPFGRAALQCVGEKVDTFLKFTDNGSASVYSDTLVREWQVFAFQVLPVIYFFSFCIQILYYYGAMQWVVLKLGWLLQVTLGTTVCESVNAAASIFLGPSESPLLFRPYICQLTHSELHAVMTGALATVAGSTIAAYISFGVSASHLLAASFMSAPAALCYSKLFYPEIQKSKTRAKDFQITQNSDVVNFMDAAAKGAMDVIFLISAICANLIAFLAFMSFLNGTISWFGYHVGAEYLSFEWILSQVFIPFAYLMGVEWSDCKDVATLIGLKTVLNEFVAYEKLGVYIKEGRLSLRSETIATYALCGFSTPGSTAIMMNSLVIMAPSKNKEITEVAPRALLAACASCFLTACTAGALIEN